VSSVGGEKATGVVVVVVVVVTGAGDKNGSPGGSGGAAASSVCRGASAMARSHSPSPSMVQPFR
jgi:hypothetical protein